ncbi:MAG: riboflavin synthase [Candidatus Omnitrophica bacterium]|nr:riboflavin synthase [Candidatus Omnitrophota bacterium]
MFNGIVEEKGVVTDITKHKNLYALSIQAKKALGGTQVADSVAVNGVCLTVIKKVKSVLTFEVMLETLKKTNIGLLQKGDLVNLERPLKFHGRIHGHFVTGHVDDLVTVKKIIHLENYLEIRLSLPASVKKQIVQKGSVAVDGVSLTVGDVRRSDFSIYLIPFTKDVTTLGSLKENDQVNIETDILAKYLANLKTH